MIRTESLTKYYGSRCAVRDLSIGIDDREIVGFLGLNGAGKTTALRMLAGLLAPSSGTIEIDGHPLDAADAAGLRWRIGFLPERPPLYEDMTVNGYLRFAAALRGYEARRVAQRVDEVTDLCVLRDYATEPVRNLSHGFRQRVGIAQAVIHDPALVILDEPTSGLDPVQIREMRNLIRDLKEKHTVLLSSHNLPEIHETCDRLLVIKEGALVHSGSETELAGRLAGTDRVSIGLSGTREGVEQALATIRDAGLVDRPEIQAEGAQYSVEADLVGKVEDVARSLVESGLGLRRLEVTKHELEDLFVEVTRSTS